MVEKKDIPVIILAAGEAKRLKPLSNHVIKPIIPIAGVPLISRIIQNYQNNGFKKFICVIGREEAGIKDTVLAMDEVKNRDIIIDFIVQKNPKGMADAIIQTAKILKDSLPENNFTDSSNKINPFFVVSSSDVLFEDDTLTLMFEKHINSESDITLSLVSSEDDQMSLGHGNISFANTEKGIVNKIIEKPGPKRKISDYYSMPIYIFSIEILEHLKELQKSERGEIEVQDAIQNMIKANKKIVGLDILPEFNGSFKYHDISAFHITYIKDILAMNRRILAKRNTPLEFSSSNFQIIEPVAGNPKHIGKKSIVGPNVFCSDGCTIGENCSIVNTYIYPGAEIGYNTELKNCIVGEGVFIHPKSKYTDKLILKDGIHVL
jgi:NDP-sugar pyrophosphorylase family protein